jgi:hypothetical protein
MHFRTNGKVVSRALDRLCRTGLIVLAGRNDSASTRPLSANRSRFQSWRLLALFCYSALALSGCGGSKVVTDDTGTLTATPTTAAFGNVAVGQASNATITLRGGSAGPVEITQLSLSGQGFAMSGQADLPITLPAGGVYDLSLQFDPVATGAATGQITVTSNSTSNATVAIALSGTGTPRAYIVGVSWDAPLDSADPVAGYNVYRSPAGAAGYELLNASVDPNTTFVDSTVQDGLSYDYIVESVDSSGVESIPSAMVSVTIPLN